VAALIAIGACHEPESTGPTAADPGADIALAITPVTAVINLTNHAAIQEAAAVSGDVVVWVDNRTGNRDIWGCRLTGGLDSCARGAVNLTNDPAEQSEPAVDGGIVVWRDARLGLNNNEIFGCDVSSASGGLAHCAGHAVNLSQTLLLQFRPTIHPPPARYR
jgi:hypothetical protein